MCEEKQSTEDKSNSEKESEHKSRFKFKIITPGALIRLFILAVIVLLFCIWAYVTIIKMPGESKNIPSEIQASLKEELSWDVQQLAGAIGERNIWNYNNLVAAVEFIETSLIEAGYQVKRQSFRAEGEICYNLEVEVAGEAKPDEIVIIGAHYDTVFDSSGANDNGSGIAAALALARRFKNRKIGRTLRFVFFANEEPPFFQTDAMGSVVYAKSCREKNENITAMLSLETIGYFTDEPKSQQYPFPFNLFYPSTGNFIGFVSNIKSRKFLRQVISEFRKNCSFPSEGAAVPEMIPGIGWSDHWAFWQQGYPAIMVTDTAPFRYPYYHESEDTPDKIDYESLAIVVSGLEAVIDSQVMVPGNSEE
ncbi:MAG: M28 family peptidase [Planctomycetota bacterium]|jgi:hypothetical protein